MCKTQKGQFNNSNLKHIFEEPRNFDTVLPESRPSKTRQRLSLSLVLTDQSFKVLSAVFSFPNLLFQPARVQEPFNTCYQEFDFSLLCKKEYN